MFLAKSSTFSQMNQLGLRFTILRKISQRFYSAKAPEGQNASNTFETVFSLPSIKYIALLNRLKVYHMIGTSIAIPTCGLLESINVVPSYTFLSTAYVGLTGVAVLSLCTLPFRNTIGFLYITNDNTKIKISSVDFWGKRKDRIISTEEWVPLLDMKPKPTDGLFMTPKLTDGTKYILPLRFGSIFNTTKMGQVLE